MARFHYREQRQGQYEAIGVRLYLDGVLLRETEVIEARNGEKHLRVTAAESARGLMNVPLDELEAEFGQVTLPIDPPICEFSGWLTVCWRVNDRNKPEDKIVDFALLLNVMEWARPWSITAMVNTLRQVTSRDKDLSFHEGRKQPIDAFGIRASLIPGPQNLEELVEMWRPRIEGVLRDTIAILSSSVSRDSLITFFDFPPPIKAVCQQYLVYFVQFLSDLGIEANAELRDIAHRVLFSVTPTEGAEALDRIRDALEMYLRLPSSPEFAIQAENYPDIAVRQLKANILHLNGQLEIAYAVLEARNAQIQALQLSTYRYQQLLATQQQAARIHLVPAGSSEADTEPLVEGVIDVIKYEGKGFTVNLPELLRRLKRSFNQE
jgi:hypothetical protein